LLLFGLYGYAHLILFFLARSSMRQKATLRANLAAEMPESALPNVITQVPLYNEPAVAERVIRAVAALDYPRERHQIQILDDSTDETRLVVDLTVAELQAHGVRIQVVRRAVRNGFKAGALAHGLTQAPDTPYCAIFDADFVPEPAFLRQTVPVLEREPRVAFVQSRWEHINATDSFLTDAQAAGIDAHFLIEQPVRDHYGLFLNFNGTGGVWRRAAIEAAGGWHTDTLTEDLDLSYRAALSGWQGIFLPHICVPAELPAETGAYRRQQFRWAKGSIQTAVKLIPSVLRSTIPAGRKLAGVLHLSHFSAHLLVLAHCILSLPLMLVCHMGAASVPQAVWTLGSIVLSAPVAMYATGLLIRGSRRPARFLRIPIMLAIAGGLALSNGRAVLEALCGVKSGFARTPKRGSPGAGHLAPGTEGPARSAMACFEIGLAAYVACALVLALHQGLWTYAIFLTLYIIGLTFLGITEARECSASTPSELKPARIRV
jgi:cellulose synthase/poly-beta-1,6-N-acetylglucosamine synthase-like glycosyltransferase